MVRPGPMRISSIVLALAVLAVACGPAARTPTQTAADELPPYRELDAYLFDDTIAPEVFGLVLEGGDPAKDPKLGERVRGADSVLRARIATVTSERTRGVATYELSFRQEGPPLAGSSVDGLVEVSLSSASPSFRMVATSEDSLVGKRVILFVKSFNEDGRVTRHWRAEPATPEVISAVENAKTLGDLEG